jgi:HD-like signal output (HDOD) protein
LTALIMEQLARRAGVDARAAYTAGLLRSTGKIALDRAMRASGRYDDIEPYSRGPLNEWEMATFSCTNGDAAAVVLQAWRFPETLVESVRDHYLAAEEPTRFTYMLNLAAGAAERCGHGLPGEYSYWNLSEETCEAAGVAPESLDDSTREALEAFGPIRTVVA